MFFKDLYSINVKFDSSIKRPEQAIRKFQTAHFSFFSGNLL